MFFQWFVAPEGRKVGSLKRRVRSQLAKWEMKKCIPLWREAHFEVKMRKTHQVRTTKKCTPLWCEAHFQFPSQNVQNTPASEVLKVIFYLLGFFMSWLLGCLSFCTNRLFIWIINFSVGYWCEQLVVLMKKLRFFFRLLLEKQTFLSTTSKMRSILWI